MLENEIAALYYFIAETITAAPYFEDLPQELQIPCVIYQVPEQAGGNGTLSAYRTDFVIHVKFMDNTTVAAYEMADTVMKRLMGCRGAVPAVDSGGNQIGGGFSFYSPAMKKVENGVCQMDLSFNRYTPYDKEETALVQEFFQNGKPVQGKNKEK